MLRGVQPRVKLGRTPRDPCSSHWWSPCLEVSLHQGARGTETGTSITLQRSCLGYSLLNSHGSMSEHMLHSSLTDSSGNFILLSRLAKLHQRLEVRTKATGPVSATCLPSKGLEPSSCECRLQG